MVGMKIRILKHVPSSQAYTPADALEVEAEFPADTDPVQAFNQLNEETARMVETWKTPFTAKAGQRQEQSVEAQVLIPTADELEKLPWKPNNFGEFVFSNAKGVEKLAEALKDKSGPVKIGGYIYSFGKDPKFINRKKEKKGS